MKLKAIFIVFLLGHIGFSQDPVPPCGNDYGSPTDETNIVLQMRFGSTVDAVNAINQAKNTRGYALGCPQEELTYSVGDYSEPSIAEIANVWNTIHKPQIESFSIDCPRIGRYENNAALGAYYANLAGYSTNLNVLRDIGDLMEAQQYSSSNVSVIDPQHEGAYGYIHVGVLNPCYPGGVVGSSVNAVCAGIPTLCKNYDLGLFAGEEFLVGDQSEPDDFYDGGIAYDHGWVGIHMIESVIQQTDAVVKGKFKNSLTLAANWAISEKEVKNHNYTAKLVWLLAQMYGWTGETQYADELNHKLNKNLLPGVLMDSMGFVKGTTPAILFEDLATIAKNPGRMWDGHNALPWYTAMNAWALTDAYVAFRDQGDLSRAAELKPYVLVMLDNLSWEINNLGVIPDQLGIRDLTYALLNGIWKVAHYEGESHEDWETAAWALWNAEYFNTYNTHSVCVGLYLLVLSDTPYMPLAERADFNNITTYTLSNSLVVYPNPSTTAVEILFDNFEETEYDIVIYNIKGSLQFKERVVANSLIVNTENWNSGVYTVTLKDSKGKLVLTKKIIVQ